MSIKKLRDEVFRQASQLLKVAPDYSNLPQIWKEMSFACFGPARLGYIPPWLNGTVFAQTFETEPPFLWKVHLCPVEADTLRVAQFALPILLLRGAEHKVAYDLKRYRSLEKEQQQGKFITAYFPTSGEAARAVKEIDNALSALRLQRCIVPTTRESGHTEVETRVGKCGIIFARICEGNT